ncbi:MAG: hypothetical protein GY791_15285 [Alphaproteobacteria bacterium]|nr:hypothetical protein [Alphaproteobacteria bacterium]
MSQDKIERKLAAILVADVVGYSRLMGEDETGTLHALQSHRYGLIDPTIGQYQGRIVKLMGDGILVEFRSVVDAVECAVAIQKGMVGRNAEMPEDQQIRFRIGINLGDVLIEGDDIYGDGVNVAARLQELAEPNGVCVSSLVFTHVDGEIEHPFTDLGAHQVKNIAKPIRAYHYSAGSSKSSPKVAFRPFIDMPAETTIRIAGGCLCGTVRYEITEPELGSMFCHCRMCQKFTGAPIVAGTTFLTESVRFIAGEPKFYQSSKIAERGFCADCGTGLVYRGLVGQWTKWTMIFTASLDDPKGYAPTYHLGVESAMPWLEVHDGLPRTRCEDSPSLVEAYKTVDQPVP